MSGKVSIVVVVTIGALTGAAAGAMYPWPAPEECVDRSVVRSSFLGMPANIEFHNAGSRIQYVIFVGPDGSEVVYQKLQPAGAIGYTSNTGHVWIVRDQIGNCTGIFHPSNANIIQTIGN